VHSSYVQSGTLLEASHLPAYCITDKPQSISALARTTTSLLTGLRQHCTASQQPSVDSVTIAVFSASLAGSWEDGDNVTDSVELGSDVDVDKFILDRLLATAQSVIDCGAGVLACQKVNPIFVLFLFLTFIFICAFTYFVIDSIITYVLFLISIVSFDFMCFIILLMAASA